MTEAELEPIFAAIRLDPRARAPMYRQLYDALRTAVLEGRLPRGARLPPTRDLALALAVSRNTVMQAFAQLTTEGYLEGRVGAGTYVNESLPDDLLHARSIRSAAQRLHTDDAGISERGAALSRIAVSAASPPGELRPFRIGVPDVGQFPFDIWSRIIGRIWRDPPAELLSYGDPQGYEPLREAIASHIALARGVRCDATQVIVVSGSQQALDLGARVLLDPGDAAWTEDPGYLGARAALTAAGARLVPVPVDADGIDVAAGIARAADARLAYVTPSHQFPTGASMSLSRRLELLEWAHRTGAWVIEDDYDSEYRYEGRPLAALQGIDEHERVVYIGTFSKVMFPSLRLGYLIVPPSLVDAFVRARAIADRHPPSVEQAAMARFIEEGHHGRHIRRMRALYDERRRLLLDAVRRQLPGVLEIRSAQTGLHIAAWLRDGLDDAAMSAVAAEAGVDAPPLSAYRIEPSPEGGLLLGFAAYDNRAILGAVAHLAAAIVSSPAASRESDASGILRGLPTRTSSGTPSGAAATNAHERRSRA